MKTKAQIEMEEVVKWIMILGGLVLVIVGIYLLRDQLSSMFESIKEFLRFGR